MKPVRTVTVVEMAAANILPVRGEGGRPKPDKMAQGEQSSFGLSGQPATVFRRVAQLRVRDGAIRPDIQLVHDLHRYVSFEPAVRPRANLIRFPDCMGGSELVPLLRQQV